MSSPKVGFVSLGCPKALVDSERILTQLRTEGYQIVPDYDNADVVVVNTCGFIDSAKAESLEAIGEAIAQNGRVIVTGCMGVDESVIRAAHPSVLAVTGPQQYEQVVRAVHAAAPPSTTHDPFTDLVPPQGIKLTPRHYAYLKISEGCNHRCSFCIIPSMRGDLVSRPVGDVLDEAQRLAQAGVKELLVISQDTSAYGVDVKYRSGFWNGRPVKTRMTELCSALSELDIWVRLHYVYPYPSVDEVIPLMEQGKILPYLDIPFQHASPRILKAMKRPAFEDKTLARIHRWRQECPDLTLRSTFIVGFPGETEADALATFELAAEARFDGAFTFLYSPRPGTEAAELTEKFVDHAVVVERMERLRAIIERSSFLGNESRVGRIEEVLVFGPSKRDPERVSGRTRQNRLVHFTPPAPMRPGTYVSVEVSSATNTCLLGEFVEILDLPTHRTRLEVSAG